MASGVVKVTKLAEAATEELLASYFAFHGKVEECVIDSKSGVGHIRFNNAAAAKSATLFDKSSFLDQVISVQLSPDGMPSSNEASGEAPTARPPTRTESCESVPTTARVSGFAGSPETSVSGNRPGSAAASDAPSSTASDAIERDTVVVDGATAEPGDPSEEAFERVERAEAEEAEDSFATGATKPTSDKQQGAAAERRAGDSPFACFARLGEEPLNDPRAVLALTVASLLTLAIW